MSIYKTQELEEFQAIGYESVPINSNEPIPVSNLPKEQERVPLLLSHLVKNQLDHILKTELKTLHRYYQVIHIVLSPTKLQAFHH